MKINQLLKTVCLFLILSSVTNCSNCSRYRGTLNLCSQYPWSRQGANSQQCECGDDLKGAVQCDSETLKISLLVCNCMTYSEHFNKTLVGHCVFSCFFLDYYYMQTTHSNISMLHYIDCTRNGLSRTGQKFGKCLPGHAPAVYSYLLACVECKDYKYNWLKYIAVAYLPLTLVFLIIILFRIKVTSGKLNAYILSSQLIAAPSQLRLLAVNGHFGMPYIRSQIFAPLYMIWNLDIFRSLYKPFCCKDYCHIHSNAVHMFIYTFQGCYKTKPYDCRYFAGIYLGFRLLNLVLFTVTTSPLYYAVSGGVCLFMTVLVAIVRPYDKAKYVVVDVLFLSLLTLLSFGVVAICFARFFDPIYVYKKYSFLVLIIPPLYATGLLVYEIFPKR